MTTLKTVMHVMVAVALLAVLTPALAMDSAHQYQRNALNGANSYNLNAWKQVELQATGTKLASHTLGNVIGKTDLVQTPALRTSVVNKMTNQRIDSRIFNAEQTQVQVPTQASRFVRMSDKASKPLVSDFNRQVSIRTYVPVLTRFTQIDAISKPNTGRALFSTARNDQLLNVKLSSLNNIRGITTSVVEQRNIIANSDFRALGTKLINGNIPLKPSVSAWNAANIKLPVVALDARNH